MTLVWGSISILIGFVVGNLFAAHISVELKYLNELYSALEALKNQICGYSCGIHEAITNASLDKKCILFDNISKKLTNNADPAVFSQAINEAPYNQEIKSYLKRLFETIMQSEESDIIKSFDITITVVEKYRNDARAKKDKNAPLYRKIGLLIGIGAAILFL